MVMHASTLPAVLSPVLTPFTVDGDPDLIKFEHQCRWLQNNGVGLAVFGTNSEANSLSVNQKLNALEHLIKKGIATDQMMPGTGACSLDDAIDMTRVSTDLGCTSVLMLPPFYYKDVTDDGLFAYYSKVIEKVANDKLQVYIYNIPPVVKFGLSVSLLERLLNSYPQTVVGMKDSSGDWIYTEACIKKLAPLGFRVYAGSETFLLQTLRAGGAGCISATANVNPKAISELAANWHTSDADQRQSQLDLVRAIFAKYPMIASMKSVVAHYSEDPNWDRLLPPLINLPQFAQEILFSELRAIDFSMPGL